MSTLFAMQGCRVIPRETILRDKLNYWVQDSQKQKSYQRLEAVADQTKTPRNRNDSIGLSDLLISNPLASECYKKLGLWEKRCQYNRAFI